MGHEILCWWTGRQGRSRQTDLIQAREDYTTALCVHHYLKIHKSKWWMNQWNFTVLTITSIHVLADLLETLFVSNKDYLQHSLVREVSQSEQVTAWTTLWKSFNRVVKAEAVCSSSHVHTSCSHQCTQLQILHYTGIYSLATQKLHPIKQYA